MMPIMRRVVACHVLLDELLSGKDELSSSFDLESG